MVVVEVAVVEEKDKEVIVVVGVIALQLGPQKPKKNETSAAPSDQDQHSGTEAAGPKVDHRTCRPPEKTTKTSK